MIAVDGAIVSRAGSPQQSPTGGGGSVGNVHDDAAGFGRAAAGPYASAGLVPFSATSQTRGVDVLVPVKGIRLARMRRGVKAATRAVMEVAQAGRRCVPWMVTLTYAEVDGWGEKHVSAYLDCVRKWASRQGFEIPYVWVAELQLRGAVHYHVIFWLPRRVSMPKADKRGWWKHGMTQTVRAHKPIGYLLKYASKGDAGRFPRGLRLFGYGGMDQAARAVRYWLCLPSWVVARAREFQRITRLPGGLWVAELTGEVWRSPWEFVRFDGATQSLVIRRREVTNGTV